MLSFFRNNKLFFCDSFNILSIVSFLVTVLYFWYGLYHFYPVGFTSEYFYRAWDLYEVFHKESFSSFVHRLFFDFETLQPTLYPVITSFFLMLVRGDFWWAIFLQISCFLFLFILFVYRFLLLYGSRCRAFLFTILLVLPLSIFRNFMSYSIEVGILVFGLIGIYYLIKDSSALSFAKAIFFLFLMALVRPIDGFALASFLILIRLCIFFWQKECELSDILSYVLVTFLMLVTFILPRSSYTILYPLFIFEAFFLLRRWGTRKFSLNFPYILPPILFVFLFCFLLSPVSYKLNIWLDAGVSPPGSNFLQLLGGSIYATFSSLEELLSLIFFLLSFFFIIFFKKNFYFVNWRSCIVLIPIFLSVLGALAIKNSSFHYHILGFFLLNLFFSSIIVAHRIFISNLLITIFSVVLILFHFSNYYTYQSRQLTFERALFKRGTIPESGCVKNNTSDPALNLIHRLKKYAPADFPFRLYVDLQTNHQNLFLEKYRIKMIGNMNDLNLDVFLNPPDDKKQPLDFYLSATKFDNHSRFKYLEPVLSGFFSCNFQHYLYLYEVF